MKKNHVLYQNLMKFYDVSNIKQNILTYNLFNN